MSNSDAGRTLRRRPKRRARRQRRREGGSEQGEGEKTVDKLLKMRYNKDDQKNYGFSRLVEKTGAYLIGTKSVTADHLGKSCSGGLLFSGPPGGAFEILQRQVLP